MYFKQKPISILTAAVFGISAVCGTGVVSAATTDDADVLIGDVDMNGIVDNIDSVTIAQHCVGVSTLSDEQLTLADVNEDGVVNICDACFIETFYVGEYEVELPELTEGVPNVYVGDEVCYNGGESVRVGIYTNLEHIIDSALINVTFDNALECVSVEGSLFSDIGNGKCSIAIVSPTGLSSEEMAVLEFIVPEDAIVGNEYAIDISVETLGLANGKTYETVNAIGGNIFVTKEYNTNYGYLKYETVDDDIDGTVDCIAITDCEEDVQVVEIPAEIDGLPVKIIKEDAFDNCFDIESIVMPDSITQIEEYAFSDCELLTEITIPADVEEFPVSAFSYCEMLSNIYVSEESENFISIDGIVYNKDGTKLVCYPIGREVSEYTISEDVTEIGAGAFENCYNLNKIVIPDSVTSIGEGLFYGCNALTDITFSKNIDTIPAHAFELCSALESIVVPDNIKVIEQSAFSACYALKNVTLPEGLTKVGESAFGDCDALEEIIIPDSVTEFGGYVFFGCDNLKNVTLPKDMTALKECVFYNCKSLESIELPDGITEIGYGTFSNCKNLKSITIPDKVESIGTYAFENCESLTSIVIPDNVNCLYDDVFEGCSNLETITIENYECYIWDSEQTIPETTIIYGYDNSTAQAYAETYGRTFVSLGKSPSFVAGDANGDDEINVADVVVVQQYLLGLFDDEESENLELDVNEDGKINVFDLVSIRRIVLNS